MPRNWSRRSPAPAPAPSDPSAPRVHRVGPEWVLEYTIDAPDPQLPAESVPELRDARFVDEVTLTVESGKGGDGLVAWHRSMLVRLGGPAGGSGGRGGNVVFVADPGLSTLLDLKHRRHIKAPRGKNGGPNNRTGAHGDDLYLRVPVGTLVQDRDTGVLLTDLKVAGEQYVVVQGGRGGRGNTTFTSSTRRSPDFAEPGQPGEARSLRLTLKLLADVGIVGLPNAGKSTLISHISNARPKIADYPFTTLIPHLGVVRYDDASFVVADIPGLIEGASTGAGLGIRFLRHVERTALFLFLLDAGPDRGAPLASLHLLEHELEQYDPGLRERRRIVVLNKIDLPEVRAELTPLTAALAPRAIPVLGISAATGEGLPELVAWLASHLDHRPGTDHPPGDDRAAPEV